MRDHAIQDHSTAGQKIDRALVRVRVVQRADDPKLVLVHPERVHREPLLLGIDAEQDHRSAASHESDRPLGGLRPATCLDHHVSRRVAQIR